MTGTTVAAAPVAAAAPVKKGAPKKAPKSPSKRSAVKSSHPAWAQMITSSVKALGEKGGSSVSAIKKHMGANFKIDMDKAAPFLKRGIKAAIASGQLSQAKGTGLTGSFKLGGVKKAAAPKRKKPAASKNKATTGNNKRKYS
jgi:histone H1/5